MVYGNFLRRKGTSAQTCKIRGGRHSLKRNSTISDQSDCVVQDTLTLNNGHLEYQDRGFDYKLGSKQLFLSSCVLPCSSRDLALGWPSIQGGIPWKSASSEADSRSAIQTIPNLLCTKVNCCIHNSSHSVSTRSILILSHLHSGLPSTLFISVFQQKFFTWISGKE